MSEQAQKVYVGNGRKIQTQYGELFKLSFSAEDVEKLQGQIDNGWVNVVIKERRSPSPSGLTHYLEVDTWKPAPREDGEAPAPKPVTAPKSADEISADDLPF